MMGLYNGRAMGMEVFWKASGGGDDDGGLAAVGRWYGGVDEMDLR